MPQTDHRAVIAQHKRGLAVTLGILQRRIERLPEIVNNARIADLEELHALYPRDTLSMDYDEWEELVGIAEQLTIVAMYHLVERETVRVMTAVYGSRRARALCRLADLRRVLKRDFQVDLDSLPGFRDINRMRGLCNDAKHGIMLRNARYRRKVKTALVTLPGSTTTYLSALIEAVLCNREAA